jgi:hypothetical protein
MGRFALVAMLACLVGCGASASDDASGGTKGGNSFGVLPELELWGYLSTETKGLANDGTLGPVTFESIRQSTDKTHALIHVSGFT